MIILIYNNDKKVVDIIKNINSPSVDGNSVTWEDGALTGINLPFLLLDDDPLMDEVVSDELIALDKKSEHLNYSLEKENEELKTRLESAELAIISLMDFM